MGKSYSQDFLDRAYGFISAGEACRSVARRMGTSASFAIRLKTRVMATGRTGFGPQGRPPGQGKIDPFRDYPGSVMREKPDATMPELATRLKEDHGVTVHPSSLSRYLIKIGYTYKKRPHRARTPQARSQESPA